MGSGGKVTTGVLGFGGAGGAYGVYETSKQVPVEIQSTLNSSVETAFPVVRTEEFVDRSYVLIPSSKTLDVPESTLNKFLIDGRESNKSYSRGKRSLRTSTAKGKTKFRRAPKSKPGKLSDI